MAPFSQHDQNYAITGKFMFHYQKSDELALVSSHNTDVHIFILMSIYWMLIWNVKTSDISAACLFLKLRKERLVLKENIEKISKNKY